MKPTFRKLGLFLYENQNGDIIDSRIMRIERGFLFNGEYITLKSILEDEIRRGEHILSRSLNEPCPQKLRDMEGYSWINDFGVWTVEREGDDLYIYHSINDRRIGNDVIRDFYHPTGRESHGI